MLAVQSVLYQSRYASSSSASDAVAPRLLTCESKGDAVEVRDREPEALESVSPDHGYSAALFQPYSAQARALRRQLLRVASDLVWSPMVYEHERATVRTVRVIR